jgi:hypothetical protein
MHSGWSQDNVSCFSCPRRPRRPAHAAASGGNPIACESQLPGTPQSLGDNRTHGQSILDGLLRQLTKKTVMLTASELDETNPCGAARGRPTSVESTVVVCEAVTT